MSAPKVDIHGILVRAGADVDAPEGSQAWALGQVDAAVAELIEAGRELQAGMDENDTRPMGAGPAKRFLAADARHRAALARIGGFV